MRPPAPRAVSNIRDAEAAIGELTRYLLHRHGVERTFRTKVTGVTVRHSLGRSPTGFLIIDRKGDVRVWRKEWDATYATFLASEDDKEVRVSIW